MKLKATVLALFAAGLLVGLTQIAPAGADGPATTTTGTTTTTAPATTTTTTTGPTTTGTQDAISALSATSITVGPYTCTIGPSSPVVSFKVGDRVKIGCANGVLLYIQAGSPLPTTTTQPTVGSPALSGFSPASGAPGTTVVLTGSGFTGALAVKFYGVPADYTVNSDTQITARVPEHAISGQITIVSPTAGDVTSSASFTVPSSAGSTPSTSPTSQGTSHASTAGGNSPSGTSSTTTPTANVPDNLQTRLGTIGALSATSITVDDLTCSIGSGSPSTSSFAVGDQVGIGCDNGVLVKIGDAPFGGDNGSFGVTVQIGTIARLTSDLIRVGSLACELADTSPNVSSFNVGDRVGIGCAGGILFMIGAVPNSTSAPATTVKQVLKQHLSTCLANGHETCTFGSALKRFTNSKK